MADRKAVPLDPVAEGVAARHADERAQVAEEVEERKLDETIPGGKTLMSDGKTWQNANGEEIDADGNVKRG